MPRARTGASFLHEARRVAALLRRHGHARLSADVEEHGLICVGVDTVDQLHAAGAVVVQVEPVLDAVVNHAAAHRHVVLEVLRQNALQLNKGARASAEGACCETQPDDGCGAARAPQRLGGHSSGDTRGRCNWVKRAAALRPAGRTVK